MLDCIKKIIKRGKRQVGRNPKGVTPWALSQPRIFKPKNDIYAQYHFEVATEILKKKVRKDGRSPITKYC